MAQPAVSIIIPVRNGARYLEECCGFIGSQTFSDYEVIFIVDTRSTDGTLDLVKSMSDRFDRFKAIEQDEGFGLGGNRNLGIEVAEGDCIWFADVDDAPSMYFLEVMHTLLVSNDADFVSCNFINSGPKGVVREKCNAEYHTKTMGHDEALISRNNDEFPVSTWSKLFRRQFLLDNELFFDESFAEDIYHTYRCVDCCRTMCITNRPLYAYRQTKGSICRNKANNDKRGQDEIASYDRADLLCKDNPEILRRNAIMKIRSSGHMSYSGFMKFAKSEKNRESYEKYLKGTFEGWWHIHLSSLYWIALRTYVVTIYKRNGTLATNKKFW